MEGLGCPEQGLEKEGFWDIQRGGMKEGRKEGLGSGSAQQHQDPRGSQASTRHGTSPPAPHPAQGQGQAQLILSLS